LARLALGNGSGTRHFRYFWYFWLTIQNTTNRHVSNAFGLLAAFISFPLVRVAARPSPHPAPLLGGGEVTKKKENRL
jgi:hypothetical protein